MSPKEKDSSLSELVASLDSVEGRPSFVRLGEVAKLALGMQPHAAARYVGGQMDSPDLVTDPALGRSLTVRGNCGDPSTYLILRHDVEEFVDRVRNLRSGKMFTFRRV
ncbi:MAG: hypothetical protein JST16_15825 [Bdellovibrionales bacterium]|nr:hypothetical protein [Bdellovibrionales bacterium]